MSWEDEVDNAPDDWEAALNDDVPEDWEQEEEEESLFSKPAITDDRVICPTCKGDGKVHPETAKRVEEAMKPQPKTAPKPTKKSKPALDERRDVQLDDIMADLPLEDPIAEKLRLQKIAEDSDKKLVDEMFSGVATDEFLSENEKAIKKIEFKSVNDYNRVATLLAKRVLDANNVVGTIEFLNVFLTNVKDSLSSDDFTKLASKCNVYKEERKKAENVVPGKKNKKKKTNASLKIVADTWQNDFNDYESANNNYYDDDFM